MKYFNVIESQMQCAVQHCHASEKLLSKTIKKKKKKKKKRQTHKREKVFRQESRLYTSSSTIFLRINYKASKEEEALDKKSK